VCGYRTYISCGRDIRRAQPDALEHAVGTQRRLHLLLLLLCIHSCLDGGVGTALEAEQRGGALSLLSGLLARIVILVILALGFRR
jgi:hypothetical protein